MTTRAPEHQPTLDFRYITGTQLGRSAYSPHSQSNPFQFTQIQLNKQLRATAIMGTHDEIHLPRMHEAPSAEKLDLAELEEQGTESHLIVGLFT
jgi:hypothetical protein